MSDPSAVATPRFFQYGFVCPGCRYDLSHASTAQCPECGMVLTEQMAVGHVREISEGESAFAHDAIGRISRSDLLAAVHAEVWRRYSVLVLVALAPALIYGLIRWGQDERSGFLEGFLIGGAVAYGTLLFVYGLLMAWTVFGFNRSAQALRDRRDHDLARGVVEEWWLEFSHRLTLENDGPMRTYLRMARGGVCGVRRDAEPWLAEHAGVHMRIAILPSSRVVVGLTSEGPGVQLVERSLAEGIKPSRSSIVWSTPIVFLKNEAEALHGDRPFAASSSNTKASNPHQPKENA